MGYSLAWYMAARLVSSIMTILQLRGCCSRYFLTVFLDSPTSMARRMRPLSASSWPILSTKVASSAQKPHQVVQNSRRTTLPLMDSLVNFSPVVVVALKRGAGSLSLGTARAQTAARINMQGNAPRRGCFSPPWGDVNRWQEHLSNNLLVRPRKRDGEKK